MLLGLYSLEANNDTIPDQLGKQTKNSTMRWIFRIMNKITVAYFTADDVRKSAIANICTVYRKIIMHFGQDAMDIYGVI